MTELLGYTAVLKKLIQNDVKITAPSEIRKWKGYVEDDGPLLMFDTNRKRITNKILSKMLLHSNYLKKISVHSYKDLDFYKSKEGRVLIPESVRFNTYPLLCIYTEYPVISRSAYTIKIKENSIDAEKALCAWINSSFSIIFLRLIFSPTEGLYGHIRMWHLKILPTPDLTNKAIVNRLSNIFDNYKNTNWKPLPFQYEDVITGRNNTRLNYDTEIFQAVVNNSNVSQTDIQKMLKTIYLDLTHILQE